MKTDDYKQKIEKANAINAALASDRPAVEEIKQEENDQDKRPSVSGFGNFKMDGAAQAS